MPTIALTDSIRGQILDDLAGALRAMTVAGGYHWNVAWESVQTDEINVLGIESERRPFFILQASPDGVREFEPANQLQERFRVLLTAIADAPEGPSPDRKAATAEALAMDVERAVTVDIRRGGLCTDTRLQVPEFLMSTGRESAVVMVVELECRIHRVYGSP
jgi:hypothetical protein